MTAAMTKLHTFFLSTDWNPFIGKNSATAVEDDSITESYSFVKLQLPVEPAIAGQELTAPSLGFAGDSLLVGLQRNRHIVAKVSSKESATDSLQSAAAPDAVQALFQHAESKLSARTEITAQHALVLLRRIRELVVDIRPNNLQGVVHAFVDVEDGSTTIEWIRNRSRLGFVLDRENKSSWFVVLSNGLSDAGYLYGDSGLKSLRRLLDVFVAAGKWPL